MLKLFAAVIALSHHHHPPAEAIEACKAKQAGDACSFTHRDHAIDGTCFAPPDGSSGPSQSGPPLACRPIHPPPEAVEACTGKAAGDACGFDLDGDHVTGACWAPAVGLSGPPPLACRPEE